MEATEQPKCYSYLRFSRPEQMKGDTIRRQLEASTRYAEENGLILDDSLSMRDQGVSAFRSKHVKRGDLGDFLRLVKEGRIERGSYLLVESLDRLSRDEHMVALRQFMDLIDAGIVIVTMMDGQVYHTESMRTDTFRLMGSLTVIMRAHEESDTKSKRLSAAWVRKRQAATDKPMTARCSAWLTLNPVTKEFEPDEERCALIKEMFDRCIAGQGVHAICKWLNQSGVKPWGKAESWGISSIAKILKTRAVLGELQPIAMQQVPLDPKEKQPVMVWKRKPIGEPIVGYYPAIIDEMTFNMARAEMTKKAKGGGKTGKITNLFPYIAACGYCGGPMHRHSSKGGRLNYLLCTRAKAGAGCNDGTSLQYMQMESAFLQCCRELDLSFLLADDNADQLAALRAELANIQARAAGIERKRANLTDAIADTDDRETRKTFISALDGLAHDVKEFETLASQLQREISTLSNSDVQAESHLAQISELVGMLGSLDGEDLIELRRKLRHAIAGVVKKITCFPNGLKDNVLSFDGKSISVEPYSSAMDKSEISGKHIADRLLHMDANTGRHRACFLVEFTGGNTRFFEWNNDQFYVDSEITDDNWNLRGMKWNDVAAKHNLGQKP